MSRMDYVDNRDAQDAARDSFIEQQERLRTIVGVAIQMPGPGGKLYQLPKPKRHHDVIHMIYAETGERVPGMACQGFLTSDGKFANRWQAHRIAWDAGQCPKRRPSQGSELFSEDLW